MYLDNWYVFWVKSGREQEAASEIIAAFSNNEVGYKKLLIETFFKKQGKIKKEYHVAFPGYIIMVSSLSNDDFLIRSWDCVSKSKNILKLLRYGESYQVNMRDEERVLIESLWQGECCMETSLGFIEGERIVVTEGPFVGKESIIKSINRHKRQAIIEVNFAGCARCLTIGLEVIDKLSNRN